MKRKIHVVPHSHWDREWYFTTSRSKVYLMKDLRDVIDTLESNEEFKYFMVDAQGSLLDDYLKWMPQDKERIEKLVKANCSYLKVGERMPNMSIDDTEEQLRFA